MVGVEAYAECCWDGGGLERRGIVWLCILEEKLVSSGRKE